MGDTFKSIIKGVVIGAVLVFTGGAIGGALGGLIAGLGQTIGVSSILGGIASLFAPKVPSLSDEFGLEIQLNGDPTAPRKVCYGEAWTAGTLRWHAATGDNNDDLYLVIVLAGHEIDSVQAVEADGEALTLDGNGDVTDPSEWAGLMNVRFHLGDDDQTADSTLDSVFGSQWTSDHRLRGLAYAIVKLTFDEEDMNAIPQFRFKLRGRKVYDPRLDSTNGGTGTHRLNDASTWAWSRNAVLCANDFMRGIKVNSRAIAGMRVADARFDWANVIAEANVCDEDVTLDAGGTQDRYCVDGFIDPRQEHGENIRHFEVAMAGDITFCDGKWRFFAGAYRTPTLHLEDKHFIGPLRHIVHKGEAEKVDTAQGVFASASNSGDVLDYPPVRLSSAVAGEERIMRMDFALVSDGAQAQRCAKLLLEREAAGKQIMCTTSLYGYRAVPGETINVSRLSFGLDTQPMRVMDVQLTTVKVDDKVGLAVNLVLEAGPESLYAWDAEETAIAAVPDIPQAQHPFVVVPVQDVVVGLINPGFETGTLQGWTILGGTWTVVTTEPHHGTYHAQGDEIGGSGFAQLENTARAQVEEGDVIRAHGFVQRGGSGTASTFVRVTFYNSSNNAIGSASDGNVITGTDYGLSKVVAVAPATAVTAAFAFVMTLSTGPPVFADGAFMSIASVSTGQIDLNAVTEPISEYVETKSETGFDTSWLTISTDEQPFDHVIQVTATCDAWNATSDDSLIELIGTPTAGGPPFFSSIDRSVQASSAPGERLTFQVNIDAEANTGYTFRLALAVGVGGGTLEIRDATLRVSHLKR